MAPTAVASKAWSTFAAGQRQLQFVTSPSHRLTPTRSTAHDQGRLAPPTESFTTGALSEMAFSSFTAAGYTNRREDPVALVAHVPVCFVIGTST